MRYSPGALSRILRKPFISLLVKSRVIGARMPVQPEPRERIFFILEANRFSHRQLLLEHAAANHFQLDNRNILSLECRGESPLSATLLDLIKTQLSNPSVSVSLIPVSFYHGTLPRREHSWLNLLYSESWVRTGWLGRGLQLLVNGRHTLMHIGKPLPLENIIERDISPDRLTQKCVRVFNTHFRQVRRSIIGPDLSHRRTLISLVLKDPDVQAAIDHQAKETGTNRHKIERHCQTTLDKIAADFSPITASILDKLLNLIWKKLYNHIDIFNLTEVHNYAESHQLIYLPCHRSHMDYLLLSWALYRNGLTIPHVAAGENLNIPLIGSILKKGGAIFMRRKFSGDLLYSRLYQAYLQQMTRRGHALEYFIEGGRSRTGRLLPPKNGLLSMSVANYLKNSSFPVAIVPVWISYDRIVENASYQQELKGSNKQKESVAMVVNNVKILRQTFGSTQLSFGKPLPLAELLQKEDTFTEDVHQISLRVMQEINRASCIHSTSLVATLFLAGPKKLTRDEASLGLTQLQAVLHKLPGHSHYQPREEPEHWLDTAIKMQMIEK